MIFIIGFLILGVILGQRRQAKRIERAILRAHGGRDPERPRRPALAPDQGIWPRHRTPPWRTPTEKETEMRFIRLHQNGIAAICGFIALAGILIALH